MRTCHEFHIPVMGTAFTIDTPIKVAKYGISSVVSLCDDELCEYMRELYCQQFNFVYDPIKKFSLDYRAKRITAYLNLLDDIVKNQIKTLQQSSFESSQELNDYFQFLPEHSELKKDYLRMSGLSDGPEKKRLQNILRDSILPGSIDVNIMTKLDRRTYDENGQLLSEEFSDALSALRGYASSQLHSSIVFSAGFNRRLYAYIEAFDDFFPDEFGFLKKKIILKVSDYRSSLTQARFLAKKGIWVSEHRIESGLNCGGHAFASDGYLLGPILEEFKQQKQALIEEQFAMCNEALLKKGRPVFSQVPDFLITVQGGIGTAQEQSFLCQYYQVDRTGWASPFLLVPEVTLLDDDTRQHLASAGPDQFYLSRISPLGVPFNTVKGTESEKQKLQRFEEGKPGSPCPKGYLVSNEEFSQKPVCTASSFYQKRKITLLQTMNMGASQLKDAIRSVVDKACLCEDLAAAALIKNGLQNKRPLKTAVCPGPNLGFFSKISTLSEMISHIYGRIDLCQNIKRSHMFINELKMYIDYLKTEVLMAMPHPNPKQIKLFCEFEKNLKEGIAYYKSLIPKLKQEASQYQVEFKQDLLSLSQELQQFITIHSVAFHSA